jgi:hypothetical protein
LSRAAQSSALTVLHRDPILSASDVGGVHGASRDIDRPAGVVFSLQISGDSVEPIVASLSRNLLSHEFRGPAGTGEPKDVGPQMPWIVSTGAFARDRERLTWAGGGPQGASVRPSSKSSCKGPATDSGEQMNLSKSSKVCRRDFFN